MNSSYQKSLLVNPVFHVRPAFHKPEIVSFSIRLMFSIVSLTPTLTYFCLETTHFVNNNPCYCLNSLYFFIYIF